MFKVKRRIKNLFGYVVFQYLRVLKYKILSNCKNVVGKPIYNQPTQLLGIGTIQFGKNVNLGVSQSPFFYSGYGYIDARSQKSRIFIDNNVCLCIVVWGMRDIAVANLEPRGKVIPMCVTDGNRNVAFPCEYANGEWNKL